MRISKFWVLLALAIGPAHAEGSDDAVWIDAARAKYNIPGISVAIVQRGKPVQFHSAGFCNVEQAIPCTESHRLPVGSVTKSITGLLAATLASEQRISLDVPAIHYWPSLKLADDRSKEITLRDLLTQQSGLGSIDWPYFWNSGLTLQDYLDRLAYVPPAKRFHAGFAYANANFVLAGKVIEAATQSTWESLIVERLLSPLGMPNSGFEPPAGLTIGYGPTGTGRLEPFPYNSPQALRPAGGLVTTASDFSHLIAVMLNDGKWEGKQIVPATAVNTMLSTGSKRGGYALGLAFTHFRDHTVFHHLGSMAGYSAAVLLLPGRWGVIVLTNRTGTSFPEGLSFALLNRHLGNAGDDTLVKFAGPPTATPVVDTSSAKVLRANAAADFTGTYRHPAWGDFVIDASGTQMRIRLGQFVAALDFAEGETFSFLSAPGWERLKIAFQRDGFGRVTGFMMDDGANPAPQPFTKLQATTDRKPQ